MQAIESCWPHCWKSGFRALNPKPKTQYPKPHSSILNLTPLRPKAGKRVQGLRFRAQDLEQPVLLCSESIGAGPLSGVLEFGLHLVRGAWGFARLFVRPVLRSSFMTHG